MMLIGMSNILVSIVTPCYNSALFVENTIKSVLSQTFKGWEMLIIDDCSTDNSAQIVKKYTNIDSRIRYLKTEVPSGSPTQPRNIGIENAKGKYIAFLDSDDMWLPNKLQEQIELLKKEDTAIVFSNYEKINEEGRQDNRYVIAPLFVTYEELLLGNVIGCLTAMYDTSKVGKVFFLDIHHEDYIMWLFILKQGFIARNTNSINALYRIRVQSVSSNKLIVLSWQWNIYINVEKTGYIKGVYCFLNYAYRAFYKALK